MFHCVGQHYYVQVFLRKIRPQRPGRSTKDDSAHPACVHAYFHCICIYHARFGKERWKRLCCSCCRTLKRLCRMLLLVWWGGSHNIIYHIYIVMRGLAHVHRIANNKKKGFLRRVPETARVKRSRVKECSWLCALLYVPYGTVYVYTVHSIYNIYDTSSKYDSHLRPFGSPTSSPVPGATSWPPLPSSPSASPPQF